MSKQTAIQSFRKLEIWQLSHQLVINTYKLAKKLPSTEKFGITSQLTRASVSIPANIAEGYGRKSDKEFIQFLHIAIGSLEEVRYYYILCQELQYFNSDETIKMELLINEIRAKAIAFIQYLKSK